MEPSEEEKKEIEAYVNRFENMVRNGRGLAFFDEEEYLCIIEHYLMEQNYPMAELALELAQSMYPSNIPIQLRRVSLLSGKQEKGKALRLMQEIDAPGREVDATTLYEEAMLYSELQKWDLSEKKFLQIFTLPEKDWNEFRQDPIFYADIAEMYTSKDDLLSALPYYVHSWDLEANDDTDSNISFLLCEFNARKQLVEAADILIRGIEQDPLSEYAWIMLGKIQLDLKHYQQAEDAYDHALSLGTHTDCILDLASVYVLRGREEQAEALFKEYQDLHWDEYSPDFHIASVCYDMEEWTLSMRYCQKAIDRDPGFYQAYNLMAFALGAQDRYMEGIPYLQKSLELFDDDAFTYINLGEFLMQENRDEEAGQIFQQTVERYPDDSRAWLAYADYLADTEQLDAAISVLREVVRFQPKESAYFYRLAYYHFLREDDVSGMSYLEYAYRMNPNGLNEFMEMDEKLASVPLVLAFLHEIKNQKK